MTSFSVYNVLCGIGTSTIEKANKYLQKTNICMVDVHMDAFCLDVTIDVREQTKQKEEISYYNDNEHSNTLKYYYWL